MNSTNTRSAGAELSAWSLFLQCSLMGVVFYLWSSPVMQPVKIMVVLFHEMSHGIVALASGGQVRSIMVTADEGGACETVGGVALLIVSAGYLGSMFFGGLLLYLSNIRGSAPIVYTLLTLVLASAIMTVLHDPYSRTFATALAGSFICIGLLAPNWVAVFFLRVLGTVSCLYSMIDIYSDILATPSTHVADNDATAFARLTGIPPATVGIVWLLASFVFFLVVLKSTLRGRVASSGG